MRLVIEIGRRRVLALFLALTLFPLAANAQTLKVLDWNTHHGVGTDGEYDLQRFVTWIVRSGAQVVSLNEVEKNNGWGDEDQPARYAALLKAATGKTWNYTFAQRDGESRGQGNLILTTFDIEAASSKLLSYSRSVARIQIVVNGVLVNVFSTHLDADSGGRRVTQMAELKKWMSGFSQPRLVAGDFNAWPGASEINDMLAFAYDSWAVAKSRGTTVAYEGNSAGNTRNSRIDYIWLEKAGTQLTVKSAQVFDVAASNGVMPSDHRPVMATFQVGSSTSTSTDDGKPADPRTADGDFDGDGKADLAVYRPSTGDWYLRRSGSSATQIAWGSPNLGDLPVVGDYDGDGEADLAVFRLADGVWYRRLSSTKAASNVQWGNAADLPVPGDYDGDGKTDVAVFRPREGVWYVRYSKTNTSGAVQWGNAGDRPVPGDYDGDGKTDVAVYRAVSGTWYIRYSSTGAAAAVAWGARADTAVPADYDGDGRTDVAVYRAAEGAWYVRKSKDGSTSAAQWGNAADLPVPGDFDGDGRADIAVFRPATGTWYIIQSSTGAAGAIQWGNTEDRPVLSRW